VCLTMTRALQAAITSLLVLLMTLSSVLDPSHAFTDRHVRGSRHSSCAAGRAVRRYLLVQIARTVQWNLYLGYSWSSSLIFVLGRTLYVHVYLMLC
jgi:hypothetical protein